MPGAMSAEDRLEVMNLIARYAQCLDSGDVDGYVASFAPEGVIEWANGTVRGHEKIRGWVEGLTRNGGIGATPARVRHVVGMPEINGDSERWSPRPYVLILSSRDDGAVVVSSIGSYADTIVKTDAALLFEKRVMRADLGVFGRAS